MYKKNLIGLAIVAIFVVILFAYIDFFAQSPALSNKADTATSTVSDIVEAQVGTSTISIHDQRRVEETIFSPTQIIEDSRCPSDVQCIQAGQVVVSVSFSSPQKDWSVDMKPGDRVITPTFTLTLNDVEPAPISTQKIADSDYKFSFTVGEI